MLLTSTLYLIFILICIIVYYRINSSYRWILLLVASILFYCSYNPIALLFVLVSSISVYFASIAIERKADDKKGQRRILIITLLLNFGILAYTKYFGFLLTLMSIDSSRPISVLVPLGISFYTFQIVGYLLDIYWKRDQVEHNFFKLLLFAIYFPQIIQGPISRHKALSIYFDNGTEYDFLNIKYGIQLMIWGYFKKMVIADTIATAAGEVLDNPGAHTGLTVIFGLLAYSAELYMDFSGGIDVIRGTSQCFGINLVENFKRPYFAQSIQDFWRRWHITLGTWMKDYLFYPMALSKTMNKLGKRSQKLFGKKVGRKIPLCLENIIVFFVVGIWHGPSMHFIVYGLYNGLIIALSTLLEPVYDKLYCITRINRKSVIMNLFRIIRTFILVNIGWYFDDVSSLNDSLILIKNTFIPNNTFYDGVTYLGLFKYQYGYVTVGLIMVFVVSIMQERGIEVRKKIDTLPYVVKMGIWLAIIFMIPIMGWDPSVASGFMYANF